MTYKEDLNKKKKTVEKQLKEVEEALKSCKMFSREWDVLFDKQRNLRVDLATVKSRIANLKTKAYMPNLVIYKDK